MSKISKYIIAVLIILNMFTFILLMRKSDIKIDGIRFTTPEININGEIIKNDLVKNTEKFEIEGVKGGKVQFNNLDRINILNEKWVMAYFDDGHIDGEILLEYIIDSNGQIIWRTIDKHLY
jgi:hypothetical protein